MRVITARMHGGGAHQHEGRHRKAERIAPRHQMQQVRGHQGREQRKVRDLQVGMLQQLAGAARAPALGHALSCRSSPRPIPRRRQLLVHPAQAQHLQRGSSRPRPERPQVAASGQSAQAHSQSAQAECRGTAKCSRQCAGARKWSTGCRLVAQGSEGSERLRRQPLGCGTALPGRCGRVLRRRWLQSVCQPRIEAMCGYPCCLGDSHHSAGKDAAPRVCVL
jgi:hypothetical protein